MEMNINKITKGIGRILLWILGIWMGLLLIVQIVLLPPIFTRIANNVTDGLLDADISFGRASGSVLRHFPRVSVTIEDLEITYPHERYDSVSKTGPQGHLLYSGCNQAADTLACVRKFSASVSLLSAISGNIKLPHIEIDSPRLFAHSYDQHHANWNIFGSEEIAEEVPEVQVVDTHENNSESAGDAESLNIILKKINITGNPTIVYTDSQDSLFAMITLSSFSFDGKVETAAIHKASASTRLEKLFVAGRYGADTLALELDRLTTQPKKDRMHIEIEANTFMATKAFGRMKVPVTFHTDLSMPEDPGMAISLRDIDASIAMIPAQGHLDVKLRYDRAIIDGQIDIIECKVQQILHDYLALFVPEAGNVQTDTEVTVKTSINGYYGYIDGTLPQVNVSLDIPDSEINYETFPARIQMGMNADFSMDPVGVMNTDIKRVRLHTYGLDLDAALSISDLTGEDPAMTINGNMQASLDSLRRFIPDSLGLNAQGSLSAELNGAIKMSELDIYQFSNASLEGGITGNNILVQMPQEGIDAKMHGLEIKLKPEFIKSRRNPGESYRLMGINGSLASADIAYQDAFSFEGKNISIGARNSADGSHDDPQNVQFVGGHVNAEMLLLNDSEGTSIKLDKTQNTFQMRPKRGQPTIPVLSLSNKNLRITYITDDNRIILTDSQIAAMASMNTIDRQRRREAFMDSLAKANPTIPRDSLMIHLRSQRASREVPTWMTDDSFKDSDIKIDLNETFKTYFKEWDIEANAGIRTGIFMTPYLPLRNILRGAYLSLNNNRVAIDSLKVMAGESEICAKGSVSGLRRFMLGRGNIHMDLNLYSTSVNADELLTAYTVGSQYEPAQSQTSSQMSNSDFFKQVTIDTVMVQQSERSLLVLPGNLNAKINIDATGIKYKDLDISSFGADMLIKERCAQLTNTSMRSNMGGFDLDAFYATKSANDIRTGFCLDIKDVTSERVVALMPEMGEVIPMIGSIKGLLNCEIAATASLDTAMNIIMPSVNGIARLSGQNLSISDDEVYTAVAKKLFFRNKKKGEMDNLLIEGHIKENRLEVFPFILKVDRYTLGLSGIQNMDMSYKHHISVLRSPLLLRLGLNISGPDYDNMKFRLGRAQYRVKNVPSFTAVIDQTKNELRSSIYNIFETGVDKTINNHDTHHLIIQHQNEIGYTNAAEMEMEELSEEDLKRLEQSENAENALEEAIAAAVVAVQEVLKK